MESISAEDLRDARVAFMVPPSAGFVPILHAIWRSGGVAVPLALSHPPPELEFVIRDAAASIVIGVATYADILKRIAATAGAKFIPAEELSSATSILSPAFARYGELRRGKRAPRPSISSSRPALILYTSGTTGRPKGVVTTHANIAAQIASLVEAWEWTAHDRTLLVLPLHHVHGLINVVSCAHAVGALCEMHDRFDADEVWNRLASREITVFSAVPAIYHRLIASWETAAPDVQRARSEGARTLRLMMSGSAALPVRTLERWREITGHTLLERYGMTEIGMALSNPLQGERRPGCVGTPLPSVEVRIVDDAGDAVASGAPGELEVRGPTVFEEYWRRPDETRLAFRNGWFRTGDVAVLDRGSYRLLGRTNIDIIKTGGFKVSAIEIEEVLREHPAIADCAVVAVPDATWGERVCVAVEPADGASLVLVDLQHWAKARLAPYKLPRDLRCVIALPRNAMGKVVKSDVAAMFQDPA